MGARAHRIGDIDTVRRLPELAQITTVDAHRGDHLHPAEIEIDPLVAAERARRDGEARAPRRGAGKVSNTKIVVPVKRTQPIERARGRGAEVWREGGSAAERRVGREWCGKCCSRWETVT